MVSFCGEDLDHPRVLSKTVSAELAISEVPCGVPEYKVMVLVPVRCFTNHSRQVGRGEMQLAFERVGNSSRWGIPWDY